MSGVDFLPQRIKVRRLRRRRLTIQVCLLLLCGALAAVLGYVRQGRIATARAGVALVARRAEDIRRQVGQAAELETQLGELRVVGRIEEHLGRRVNTLGLLAELERRWGLFSSAASMRSIRLESPSASSSSFCRAASVSTSSAGLKILSLSIGVISSFII